MSKISSLSLSMIAQFLFGTVFALLGLYVAYSAQNTYLKEINPFNFTLIGVAIFLVGSLMVVAKSDN